MKIKRVSDATSRKFRMRVLHYSDNHGAIVQFHGRYDIVLSSGDFCPNFGNRYASTEATYQVEWLRNNAAALKQVLQGHPFLFLLGNHDFIEPSIFEAILRDNGIKAISLHEKVVEVDLVKFYGFPYVPYINGMFNYERHIQDMQVEVDKLVIALNNNYVDVLVCHAPLPHCLDLTIGNDCIGSSVIANALDFSIEKEKVPSYFFHGHCHEANGVTIRNNMLISNAAKTQHIIEIK
jgi:Icc-related predicted phosphoesterase